MLIRLVREAFLIGFYNIGTDATKVIQDSNHTRAKRLALTNELMRLIWASYKESYFLPSDQVFFKGVDLGGRQIDIKSSEDATAILYDSKLKSDLKITGIFQGRQVSLESTNQLLNELRPHLQRAFSHVSFSEERWRHWLAVSQRAVEDESLAIVDKFALDQKLDAHESLLAYALTLSPNECYIFFNRYAAYAGRYDMPFAKMKLPLSTIDALKYAPEFGREIPIMLAALHKQRAQVISIDSRNSNTWLALDHPEAFSAWEGMLKTRHLNPSDYVVLPIHPLAHNLYQQKLETLVISQELIWDTNVFIQAKAGLSYRTMIPIGKESGSVIKLPVPLQLTGYIRYIDWKEINFAPQMSNALASIFRYENNFENRIRFDRELMTICVAPTSLQQDESMNVQYFSCLIRENQSRELPNNVVTMPLAALFSASSRTQKPVLIEIMELAGVATPNGAVDYFKHYIDKILKSVLTLYLRHGIMLEAHQQNLGITFTGEGKIETLHYHDVIYAIFIYRPAYLGAGHDEKTLSGLPYVSDSARVSYVQFVHTVLLLNLFPVIALISSYFHLPRTELMKLVVHDIKTIVEEERTAMRQHSESRQAIFSDFYMTFENYVLGSPTFQAKRLLGRLYEQSQTKFWGIVPNTDTAFTAVRGSQTPIVNPLYILYTETIRNAKY